MTNRTIKICAGEYKRTDGDRTVVISRIDYGRGGEWIAAAAWDHHLYTDPLATKRDAVFNADLMLTEA